jgi:hypothetical protein
MLKSMLKRLKSFEALLIFALYFIPILAWSLFGFSRMNAAAHWTFFSFGLTLATFGGVALWLLTEKKEPELSLPPFIPSPPPPPAPEPIKEYIPSPVDPILKKENEMLEGQIQTLKEQYLERQETDAAEILHLKECLEKASKDEALHLKKLEEQAQKIQELEYEIKALIDFNQESVLEPPLDDPLALTEQDAGRILKKWLDAAAAFHPEEEPQEAEKNLSRLFQGEPNALVFCYQKDGGKVVASSGHTLTLFGLTPDQFAAKFHTLVPKDSLEWHTALGHLSDTRWSALNLQSAKAVLAQIPRGPLKGNLIGIAY